MFGQQSSMLKAPDLFLLLIFNIFEHCKTLATCQLEADVSQTFSTLILKPDSWCGEKHTFIDVLVDHDSVIQVFLL